MLQLLRTNRKQLICNIDVALLLPVFSERSNSTVIAKIRNIHCHASCNFSAVAAAPQPLGLHVCFLIYRSILNTCTVYKACGNERDSSSYGNEPFRQHMKVGWYRFAVEGARNSRAPYEESTVLFGVHLS
jgi:hypothetical protein